MLKLVPLIPSAAVKVALVIGAALQGSAAFMPEEARPYAWGLGAVAWLLAGMGTTVPAWLAGKPLAPLAAAPILLSLYEMADKAIPLMLPMLPESVQGWAGFILGVLALAAGKVLPRPLTTVEVASGEPKPGETTANISAECSIADRIRGLC